jgi:hypothetical protein
MSRKLNLTLALATASVIAAASLASTSADARTFSAGGKSGGNHITNSSFASGKNFHSPAVGGTSGSRGGAGSENGGRSGLVNGGNNGGNGGLVGRGGDNGGNGGLLAKGGDSNGGYRNGEKGGSGCGIECEHPVRGGDNGGRGDHPKFPGHPGFFHDHGRWVFRDGRWIIVDAAIADVPVVAPAVADGPCTCLIKTYTPDGLVVFADVCTKEAASAPVGGSAPAVNQAPVAPQTPAAPPADDKSGDATQAPTSPNYAGLTYQDYLAMNAQTQKN